MRCGALEIEAVARLHAVVFVGIQPDFEFAAKNVQEFFAFMSVGLAAATAALDPEKMRLHSSVAPGEQLHANAPGGLKNLAFGGPYQTGIVFRRFEERKNIGAIVARNA